jgi:hypothetical protein
MASPFPALHAVAIEAATARTAGARACRDRAGQLLDEIDGLIGSASPVNGDRDGKSRGWAGGQR